MLLSSIWLTWGCPRVSPDEGDGLLASVGQWAVGLYLSHPIAVPLIGGVIIAAGVFAVRRALWGSLSWLVRGVTWPVRKGYAFLFARKSNNAGYVARRGRSPIVGEKAYFGPDKAFGLKNRRLGVVTAIYGGVYRGHDTYSGDQMICSPENVNAV